MLDGLEELFGSGKDCPGCLNIGICCECLGCFKNCCVCNPCQHGKARTEECVFCEREEEF